MTQSIRQRKRILRVRAIEHKAAALRLSQANSTLLSLGRIAQRLGELKGPLSAGEGTVNGQMLNAMAEMSQRIDDAHASLAHPIDEAKRTQTRVEAERQYAKMREDGIGQLIARAVKSDEQEFERRADANRPRNARSAARKEYSK